MLSHNSCHSRKYQQHFVLKEIPEYEPYGNG